jgi:hypothetical protein
VDRAGALARLHPANRTVWAAFALSVVLHAALLWGVKPDRLLVPHESPEPGRESAPLVLQLAPAPAPGRIVVPSLAPPSPRAQSAPARRPAPAPVPKAAPRPPAAPVIAQSAPAPAPAPQPAAPAAAPGPPAPPDLDFSSFLEARRRARAENAPPPPQAPAEEPVESERERHNRAVAANLGLSRTPTYGPELAGGGVFQIQRLDRDHAEFLFFGWNRHIRRNSRQRIEVARGEEPDIRIAVVRRMMVIIRENESGDFTWISRVQGRNVTLSARPQHTAELEGFLMEEFFGARPRF